MGTKLNTSEFKKRIYELNPDIEVLGGYVNARTPILCQCNKCGLQWSPIPDNLSRRPRCPKCVGKYRRTNEAFLREMERLSPNIRVIGNFKKTADHIKVECKKCGHVWSPSAGSLLRGYGCPNCRNINNAKKFAMCEQDFLDRIHQLHPNIKILGTYKNSNTNITCRCNVCGHEWAPKATSLLRGYGCPSCEGNIKKTHEQFLSELIKTAPNVVVLGTYQNTHTKILCKCDSCGNLWEGIPNNLLSGEGCPRCALIQRTLKATKTQSTFIEEIASKSPSIEILGEYRNAHTKIQCRCKKCGHIWNPLPMDLVKGTGCPDCCHTSTSFMEQIILLSFREMLGKHAVLSRDKKLIGLELDIYVPELKLAIEPGAWAWHADKLARDMKKRDLCHKSGIKLITIYDSYPYDKKPFNDDCFVFKKDVATEKDHTTLKKLVEYLFKENGIDRLSDELWKRIEVEAYTKSRKITTSDFIEKLEAVNSNVEIIGRYKNSNVGISCKCKMCGYEWSPTPSHLLEGKGCPKCAGHMKKTQAEFEQDLQKKNPLIIVLGKYTNTSTPILVKCKICNNEWQARPGNLLIGHGCPKCARKRVGQRNRLTHEQFLERMKLKGNPNTIILGRYVNSKTKILCKCKNCGHEWMATPDTLLHRRGCYLCSYYSDTK